MYSGRFQTTHSHPEHTAPMKLYPLLFVAFAVSALSPVQAQILDSFQIGNRATVNPPAGTNINVWPSSGNESPPNVIDGNSATKYLNFGELNTGFLITYTSPVTANGINLTTANDTEARDPATFSLYGSTTVVANTTPGTIFNLSSFTLIVDSQALSLPVARLTAAPNVGFTNTNAYQTYLVVFPTVKNAAGANSMQIAEAVLTNGGTNIPAAGATVAGGQLIPEPSAVCLLTLAGVGMISSRRRRS
jgi:hypothetical protein